MTITWLVHSVTDIWCCGVFQNQKSRCLNAKTMRWVLCFIKRYLTVVIVYWSHLQTLFVSLWFTSRGHMVRRTHSKRVPLCTVGLLSNVNCLSWLLKLKREKSVKLTSCSCAFTIKYLNVHQTGFLKWQCSNFYRVPVFVLSLIWLVSGELLEADQDVS